MQRNHMQLSVKMTTNEDANAKKSHMIMNENDTREKAQLQRTTHNEK